MSKNNGWIQLGLGSGQGDRHGDGFGPGSGYGVGYSFKGLGEAEGSGAGAGEYNGRGHSEGFGAATMAAASGEPIFIVNDSVRETKFCGQYRYWFTREEAETELAVRLLGDSQ
jgi:hypothetical protein